MSQLIFKFYLLVNILLISQVVNCDTCTFVPEKAIPNFTPNGYYEVSGTSVRVSPIIPGTNRYYKGTQFLLSFVGLREYPIVADTCRTSGSPYKEIYIDTKCSCSSVTEYLSPYPNINEKLIEVTSNCSSVSGYEDMIVKVKYRIANDTYIIKYNDTTYTNGVNVEYNHTYVQNQRFLKISHLPEFNRLDKYFRKDYMSVGVEIINWPWSAAPSDSSAVGLIFQLNSHAVDLGVWSGNVSLTSSQFKLTNIKSEITVNVDHGFIIDDIPFFVEGKPSPETFNQTREDFPIVFSDLIACIPSLSSYKWNKLSYDPSLGSLYSGPVDSPKSSSKAGIIAAAVIVPIVVIIIVVIIVLYLTVPAVREFVSPFSKRKRV